MRHYSILMLIIGMLLTPIPARAHKVTVFAWIETGTVFTESKFSGGRRVKAGKIEVFDHNRRLVAGGTTDDGGRFNFPVPAGAQTLDIVLTAGMGHTNHWTVTAEELGAAAPLAKAIEPATVQAAPVMEDSPALDADTIEKIVERSLEKKLAPLKAQLAQQSWGLRDIVAGLGYILGLMGLASYLQHRKKGRASIPDTRP